MPTLAARLRRALPLGVLALAALASPACAAPAPYVVAPDGSDGNPGTLGQPWRTLEHAMATLKPGETAYVRRGVYVEGGASNALQWTARGTATAPITLRGYPGEESGVVVRTQLKLVGSWLRVEGLTVEGNTHPSSARAAAASGDVNVWLAGPDDALVGCEVRGSSSSGVFVEGARSRVTGNHIHDNGTHAYLDHGVYWARGAKGLVADNVIDHNVAFGVQLYPAARRVVVTQNTVVVNGLAGVIVSGDDASASNGNTIVNNILALNGEEGVRTGSTGRPTSGNVARRNLVFGNNTTHHGAGDFWVPIPGLALKDNLVTDPGFVDAAHGDYRLRPGSAAIGRALPAWTTTTDVRGRKRDAAPDLGAYEAP